MMGRWTYSYRRKWRLIALAVFTLLMIQFLLAYNFYSANHDEEDRIETWQRRVEALEIAQQNHIKSANENVKHENELRTPGGAADGPNILHPMTPRTGNETLIKRCDLKSKDALSALSRATSHQCQQEIIDTACRNEAQTLYPQHITSTCTLRDKQGGVHLGCFEDQHNHRTLDAPNVEFRDHNSPHRCINYCLRMGYRYAGVEYGYECWCGESVMMSRLLKENRCTTQCAGQFNSDRIQYCGGYLALNVYNTGLGEKIQNAAPLISSKDLLTTERRVRIVFLLSLNGRALRQVTRFIKTIYHKEHYYYIHIDARQEYLHRELSRLLSGYTNIRFTSWRMSTIWGGSSLLTMLRRSMADLLDMAWEWDYFINLSESDYPLKTVDELVAYLTRFNTNNFVKSHGNNNTPRFIRKQGLDRTFYECDTHMWRLGDRSLPDGIRVDGGSDWLCLHRTFITYAMKEGNPLIDGLLQYWNHSLLSAESFFHTVLQNSKFCESIINNNLHLTNWRRKQGCKCQYKHVVDWCGCSPNDFLTEDLDKLMETEKKPLYFARKFEAIINQEVINQLEMVVFDKTQENIPGWQSFWMNLYHFEDQWNSSSDSQHTVYKAFTRIATKHVQNILHSSDCAFTPGRVLEVYSYHHVDTLQGVTIRYEALQQSTNENVELEALIHIQRRYTIVQPLGPANRLLKLQVGNQYDPKEEMFRNVGSILGPYDSVSMIAEWTDGDAFTATFTWVDPAGNVAATYEQTVKEEHYVLYHSASLDTPLRPGLWTLKMSHMWAVAAETQFVITPFSYYGGRAITPDEARAIHRGPSQQKAPSSIEKAPNSLNKEQLQELYDQANRNAEKTGVELLDWIDRLLTEVWRVSDVCLLSAGVNKCNALSPCIHKAWSPATKDPKSEIHGVDPKTGRMVP